jgi:hypothetical protein
MRNMFFDAKASTLELIPFKKPVYVGNIKGKSSVTKSGLVTVNFKVKKVKSITSIWNPDKEEYDTECFALCERLITE